jgi:colicin import membrane protein
MTEIVKINPLEFGLTEETAKNIKAQFDPMLRKMEELEQEFNEVMAMNIEDPLTAVKAKEVRLKYVKVRTGTAEIHKIQKAFYLNGGRFVDGWKNAQLFASQGKEEQLEAREKYQENLRKQELERIEKERIELLSEFSDVMPLGLGTMQQEVFDNYLAGVKIAHEARIAAEKKAEADRIEAERIQKLSLENKIALLPWQQYIENFESLEYSAINEQQRNAIIDTAKEVKAQVEAENAKILEAKIAAEKKLNEERAAALKKEKEAADALRAAQQELENKRIAEEKEKQRLKAIEDARIAAEKKAAKAPDKDKLTAFVHAIALPTAPTLQTIEHVTTLNTITAKFEAFKAWALSQTENA